MGTYLVVLHRSGPQWDPSQPLEGQSGWDEHAAYMDGLVETGPLADEHRVVHIAEGASEDAVRAAFERDPWSGTHLHIASIDALTVRLDGRNRS
jgi:hypothetical protein